MPHGGHAVAQSQYYAIKRGFVLRALGIRLESALAAAVAAMTMGGRAVVEHKNVIHRLKGVSVVIMVVE